MRGEAKRAMVALALSATAFGACAGVEPPKAPAAVFTKPAAAGPSAEGPLLSNDLGAWIDAYVAGFGARWGDAYRYSGFVAVAQHGSIVFERGYGLADREKGRGFDRDTRFRAGSITKQFVAAAVLRLAEQKKLSLSDSVRKWIPALGQAYEPVTIHHLLVQTSGAPEYRYGIHEDAIRAARSFDDLAAIVKDAPLDFDPGEKFEYSNTNYLFAGMIVERASKEPLERFVAREVLERAGMKRSSLSDRDDANRALGYEIDGATDALVRVDPFDVNLLGGAGALRTTPADLLAWDRALEGDAVLSPASRTIFFTPEKDGYACGVEVTRKYGPTVEWHNGAVEGFEGFFARVPDLDVAIVAVTNRHREEADRVGRALLKMIVGGKAAPPEVEPNFEDPSSEEIAALEGSYRLPFSVRLVARALSKDVKKIEAASIAKKDGALLLTWMDKVKRLVVGDDGKLFVRADGMRVDFDKGWDGRASTVTLHFGPGAGVALPYSRDD